MPVSDTAFAVWDIVRLPFPYTARPNQQNRPALVIAAGLPEGSEMLLWVLMITSAGNRPWPGDVRVTDVALAGLPAASVIRTAKVATVEASAATRLGQCAVQDRAAVARRLGRYLQTLSEAPAG